MACGALQAAQSPAAPVMQRLQRRVAAFLTGTEWDEELEQALVPDGRAAASMTPAAPTPAAAKGPAGKGKPAAAAEPEDSCAAERQTMLALLNAAGGYVALDVPQWLAQTLSQIKAA